MRTATRFLFIISIVIFGLSSSGFGQCDKKFKKSECKTKLTPYIFNGQLNSATLNEGDVAELMLTFYRNQDYRIVVCSVEELGNIEFTLKDAKGNALFSNKDHEFIDHWDFHTKVTQQLMVEVSVPQKADNDNSDKKSGCVSILVGFLDKK